MYFSVGSGHKKRFPFFVVQVDLFEIQMRPARTFVWFALLYQWIFLKKFQSVVAGLCIVSLILRVTARVLLYIYHIVYIFR